MGISTSSVVGLAGLDVGVEKRRVRSYHLGMPNVEEIDQRVLPIYQALNRRDLVGLQRQIAPEIVLHVAGGSAFAGTYEGLGQVLGLAGRFENRLVQNASELESVEAEGERVKVTVRVTLRTGWGELRPRLFEWFRFGADGRVVEMWVAAEDQQALDAFLEKLGRVD
jgi:hypothetical protein